MRPCTNEIDSLSLRMVPASAPVSMQLELLFRTAICCLKRCCHLVQLRRCGMRCCRRYVKILKRKKRNFSFFFFFQDIEKGTETVCFISREFIFYYITCTCEVELLLNNKRNERKNLRKANIEIITNSMIKFSKFNLSKN